MFFKERERNIWKTSIIILYTLHASQKLMCLRLGPQPVALHRDIRNFGMEARQEKAFYQVIPLQVYEILAALSPTILPSSWWTASITALHAMLLRVLLHQSMEQQVQVTTDWTLRNSELRWIWLPYIDAFPVSWEKLTNLVSYTENTQVCTNMTTCNSPKVTP